MIKPTVKLSFPSLIFARIPFTDDPWHKMTARKTHKIIKPYKVFHTASSNHDSLIDFFSMPRRLLNTPKDTINYNLYS